MIRRVTSSLLIIATLSLLAPLHAQTTWTGSIDNTWSNPGNWSAGLPSTTDGSPSSIVFAPTAANPDPLTIDATYYLSSLTIDVADYGTDFKELADPAPSGAKLIFQDSGNGNASTFTYTMLPAAPAAVRDLKLSVDMELQNDLIITRTSTDGTLTNPRRLILDGIISGTGDLTINIPSTSNGSRIEFNNHNTFTGDILFQRGYLYQKYADSLGDFNKTISVGTANALVTWDLSSTEIIGPIGYDFSISNNINSGENGLFLIQAGSVERQTILSGEFSSAVAQTASQNSMYLIGQGNQQLIFTGVNNLLDGRVAVRFGSEVVIGGANEQNIAWEKVKLISLGRSILSNSTGTGHNSAFLMRGNYIFNAPIEIVDIDFTARDKSSIGQINHLGVSYDATFNSSISVLENDYRSLNLVSENGGSATFTSSINIAGAQGMDVNERINGSSSGGTLNYYEALPTGAVIISETSRVASTSTGTSSIGMADIRNGTLVVNTENFYGDVTVRTGARLAGLGKVTGNISVLGGALLEPGFGSTNPVFASNEGHLTVTGSITLAAEAAILFQASSASFNVGDTLITDITSLPPATLQQLGNHDFLTIGADLSIAQPGALRLEFIDGFLPQEGDVFHVLDYANLLFTSAEPIAFEALWNLPNLSLLNPALEWNFDLFESHGFLVVTAASVPEPTRFILLMIAVFSSVIHRRRSRHS